MVESRRLICKTKVVASTVVLFTFLISFLVESDWHLLYLPYQLSNYHPEKMLDMDLKLDSELPK